MNPLDQLLEDILTVPTGDHTAELSKLSPADATTLRQRLIAVPAAVELMMTRGHPMAEANLVLNFRAANATPSRDDIRELATGRSGERSKSLTPPQPTTSTSTAPQFRTSLAAEMAARMPTAAQRSGGARNRLAALMQDKQWSAKALERGTAEAKEHLQLQAEIAGKSIGQDELDRFASGLPEGSRPSGAGISFSIDHLQ